MKILILDDDPERHKAFSRSLIGNVLSHTTTVNETIAELSNQKFDVLFLDHDLQGKVMVSSGEETGYSVAKWLANHTDRMPGQIIVHSFNPVGAANIKGILPQATLCPGAWTRIKEL